MNEPLLWMPTLDASVLPSAFQEWHIRRFLKRHAGYGHILTSTSGPWASMESLTPQKGGHWYCRTWVKIPAREKPLDATVELNVPLGIQDPALDLLNRVMEILPVRRLVLTRPSTLPLDRVLPSLHTLLESITASIWLDRESFGWDAVSYLAAWNPRLHIAGIGDEELAALTRLAEMLDRPVALSDFGHDQPHLLQPAFAHAVSQDPPRALNSLPLGGRSR